jgi:hypothetical protein
MLFWEQQHHIIAIEQSRQQRARDVLANKEEFVKIKDYVFDNYILYVWNQIRMLLMMKGERPVKPCSGNTKSSIGIPCSHDIFILREQNKPIFEPFIFHLHWFIERLVPGDVFDNIKPII